MKEIEKLHQAAVRAAGTFAAHQHELSDLRPEFWIALGTIAGATSRASDRTDVVRVFQSAYRRLGAPGDFGYGTPCGDALRAIYDAYKEFVETPDERMRP